MVSLGEFSYIFGILGINFTGKNPWRSRGKNYSFSGEMSGINGITVRNIRIFS
jgi:hypothetical protein